MKTTAALSLLLTLSLSSAFAQEGPPPPEGYVVLPTASGELRYLEATADSDEDGISNELELNGYRFDIATGALLACDPAVETPCFQTDPTLTTTDGDPYSDFMEVTGINMPGDVPAPYNHPLVAAMPVIAVVLKDYDVIPITEITNTSGGEQSTSFTNSVTTTEEVGGSIGSSFSLNPAELFKVESEVNYSVSEARMSSTTSTFGTNWSNSRAVNSSEAARLRLRLQVKNIGSASALRVQPTVILSLGETPITSFKLGNADAILELSPGSVYPAGGQAIPIEEGVRGDGQTSQIKISLRDLKALMSGAPLRLSVSQVDAVVMRWNVATQAFDSEVPWLGFDSQIRTSSLSLKLIKGEGVAQEYRLFAGSQGFSPGYRLRDLLDRVMTVGREGDVDLLDGVPYPETWFAATPSDALIEAWVAAQRPAGMLDVVVPRNTSLFMLTPEEAEGPDVRYASFAPGMKSIYALAVPGAGFPVQSASAEVFVKGQPVRLTLERPDGAAFYSNVTPLDSSATKNPEGSFGRVTFKDARGAETSAELVPALYAGCTDVKENEPLLPQPGGEYLVFYQSDPDRPVEVHCQFFSDDGKLLEEPVESYWFPVASGTDTRYINDLSFFNRDVGAAASGFLVMMTTDGGRSWSEAPHSGKGGSNGVAFADENTLVAVGFFRSIVRSADAGATWTETHVEDCCIFNKVAFGDPATGLAVGESLAAIYRTSDGGISWEALDRELTMSHLTDVVFPAPTIGIIVGRARSASGTSGGIMRSTDAGLSWEDIQKTDTNPLSAVAFADASNGLAVGWSGNAQDGFSGVVLRTTDGGVTWEAQPPVPGVILSDVAFMDEQVAFAVGQGSNGTGGVIIRSEDGGRSWARQNSRTDLRLFTVAAADANTAVAGGENGVLLRTGSRGGNPSVVTSSERRDPVELPQQVRLDANYPNPFSGETTIPFRLSGAVHVRVEVFDVLGRKVAGVADGMYPAGIHSIRFDGGRLTSGLYLYRLTAGREVYTRTMIVLK